MIQLDADEMVLLTRAKKGGLRIQFRDRGMPIGLGVAERRVAEALVRRGHLRFDGLDHADSYEMALYSITTSGGACLDIVRGKVKLEPVDAGHPGCG